MNIKPYRDYDEHDVINLYAYAGATASKGTIVEVVNFNPSDYAGWGNANVGAAFDGTWSKRFEVKARVKAAESGSTKVLGMLLYDVSDVTENGELVRFLPKDAKIARHLVGSGEAVPVATKGVFEVIGFNGTPSAGSGAFVADAGDGSIDVRLPNAPGVKIGKFLSSTGADGYALLKLEL